MVDSKEKILQNISEWNIPKPDKEYKLLIHCSTYKHEAFIKDALNGFVMQKTDFPFCAVIIDDCSPDCTADIIRHYAEEHPDIIKPICLRENHMQKGKKRDPYFVDWHKSAEYIAFCEGDDYWTDPLKLQKQVDFLETHPECMLCFHKTLEHKENSDTPDFIVSEFESGFFDIKTLLSKITVANASFVFRRTIFDSDLYKRCFSSPKRVTGDMPLLITASCLGKIYGISEVMSVYRQHSGGFTARLEEMAYPMCEEAIELKKIFGRCIAGEMNRRIGGHASMAIYKMRSGKGKEGRKLWWLAFRNAPWSTVKYSTLRLWGFLKKKIKNG